MSNNAAGPEVSTSPPSTFWCSIKGTPLATFALCFIGMTLTTADQALFSFAIPGITQEYAVPTTTVTLIITLSFLVASFTVVIAGTLSDYFGRRKMFVILLAGSAFCVGLHAIAQSLTVLGFFRILGFAIAAGLYPITNTIVIEVSPARYRGMMAGFLQVSYPIGTFLASLFAAPLIDAFSWRAIFYPAYAVVPLAFILGYVLKEPDRFAKLKSETVMPDSAAQLSNKRGIAEHLDELIKPQFLPRTAAMFIGTLFIQAGIIGMIFLLPTFLVEDRGFSQSDAARITGLSYLMGAIGYVLASTVGEFVLTRRNTLVLWALIGGSVFGLTVWLAQTSSSLIIGFGLTIMFLYGSEAIRMPLTAELFPTRIRATASATVGSLAVSISALTAPFLLAYFAAKWGWTWTWTIFAIIPAFIAAVIFLALPNFKSGLEVEEVSEAAQT